MDKRHLKRLLKVVAGDLRLDILGYLKRGHTATVGEIAEAVDRAQNTVSVHLHRLEQLGIVIRRQRGKYATYRLSLHQEPLVRQILGFL